jgi:alpha-L-rhamnosidase
VTVRAVGLRTEGRDGPIGLGALPPRLEWRLEGAGRQTACQVEVTAPGWDSGRLETGEQAVLAGGLRLESRKVYRWRVRVWDEAGAPSDWSEPATFETGLLHPDDWEARWIGGATPAVDLHGVSGTDPSCDDEDPTRAGNPLPARVSPLLRRSFTLTGPVTRARLHATALGLAELFLNGTRVSDTCLLPGWTDYRRRVLCRTFDVTHLLQPGENLLGAVLADGWYAGHVGLWGTACYGTRPLLRAQLELDLADGRRHVVATNGDWLTAGGEVRYADLLMGQTIDHRESRPGAGDWRAAEVAEVAEVDVAVEPDPGPPAVVTEELTPVAVSERPDGRHVVDMGQNMVGWVRLRARGPRGRRVVLRYAEALQPDGELYRSNLRSALAVDEFVLGGDGEEVFEPRFTIHGFRHVEVSGFPGRLRPEDVTGCVVSADVAATGSFTCSNPDLNRLQDNIGWSQRGNFLSVPTDCPQRDERLGWTGDAQVFAPTALFNADVRAFLERWMQEVVAAQRPDGAIPDAVPEVPALGAGTSGWGDAVVVVPWTLYWLTGDLRVATLAQPAIERWLDYLTAASDELIRPATGYGDWLSVDAPTPRDLAGTAWFANSARLAADLARALGRDAAAARHDALFAAVRRAFRRRFVRGDGRVAGETQTAYVLALHAGLLDPGEEAFAVERLVADIRSRNWHLSTGFMGTPRLLEVLATHGRLDVAHRLLLQDTYPSWLHQVRSGATTMWERWDTWTEGKGFHTSHVTEGIHTAEMNSLNHYAYGSVGAFLYEWLGGIRCLAPGYARVRIAPRPAPGVTWARTSLETPRGRVACAWRLGDADLEVDVELPPGITGEVALRPSDPGERIGPGRHHIRAIL